MSINFSSVRNLSGFPDGEKNELFSLLQNSFPDFTQEDFQKVISGKNFTEFIVGKQKKVEGKDEEIVCCCCIFYQKMGLFCVKEKRKGVGTLMFKYITSLYKDDERSYENPYKDLEWSVINTESYKFYLKMGAKEKRRYYNKGVLYRVMSMK